MTKLFKNRDFLFNNGVINLYQLASDFEDIKAELNSSKLSIEFEDKSEDEVFQKLFRAFIEKESVVFQTDNERTYFDEKNMMFVRGKKIDIVGRSSGNDTKTHTSIKQLKS